MISLINTIIKIKTNDMEFEISKSSISDIMLHRVSGHSGCLLRLGSNSIVSCYINFDKPSAKISIGDRTFIGKSNIVCANSIDIGNDVLISWGCTIVDHDSHPIAWRKRSNDVVQWKKNKKDWSNVNNSSISIMDKAWIGFNVILLKNVEIGEGAIIGAGSVVTKNVPPWTIVAGNPARIIRELTSEERKS